jgi:hypothetical protein
MSGFYLNGFPNDNLKSGSKKLLDMLLPTTGGV